MPATTVRRPRRPARTGYGVRSDRAVRRPVRGHHAQRFAEHNKPSENQRDAAIDDGDCARPLDVCKSIGFASEGLPDHPRFSNHRGLDPLFMRRDQRTSGVHACEGSHGATTTLECTRSQLPTRVMNIP